MYYGYFDGSSKIDLGITGIGAYIADQKGNIICEISESIAKAKTNNEAEYLALIRLLQEAIELDIREITIYGDSSTVIKQINSKKRSKSYSMEMLRRETKILLQHIKVTFIRIPRNKNRYADYLSNCEEEVV